MKRIAIGNELLRMHKDTAEWIPETAAFYMELFKTRFWNDNCEKQDDSISAVDNGKWMCLNGKTMKNVCFVENAW